MENIVFKANSVNYHLLKYFLTTNPFLINSYLELGGYTALKKSLSMKANEVIEETKKSNLRGRGGAGFPTGMKWSFVPKESAKPKYLCVNADEGEPGTYKDRQIMYYAPHLLIEGITICCYAVGIHTAYIYVRGEFTDVGNVLQRAIDDAYKNNYLGKNILNSGFDLDIFIHYGAGAYICGEETALIESLEGKPGKPRLKPPFPAVVGLFDGPTVINNVETLAAVPDIINQGAEWYSKLGSEKNGGTRLFGLSGHINKPGVYELPMGSPLLKIIENQGGGVLGGKKLKAVVPGGSSSPVLTAAEVASINMDYDQVAKAGSMLGSAAVIVIAEGTCMIHSLNILSDFYAHESCGQCTPCREGTGWLNKIITRIEKGKGTTEDLDLLLDITDNMMGKTICPLADAAAMPVASFVQKFKNEFLQHIEEQKCPYNGILTTIERL